MEGRLQYWDPVREATSPSDEYDSSRRAVDPELVLAAEYELAEQYDVAEQDAMLQNFSAAPRLSARCELPTEYNQPYMTRERERYELPETPMSFPSGPSQVRTSDGMRPQPFGRQLQEPVRRDTYRQQSESQRGYEIDRGFGERSVQGQAKRPGYNAGPNHQPEFRRAPSTTRSLVSVTDRQMQTREPRGSHMEIVPRMPPQSAAQVALEPTRTSVHGEDRMFMAGHERASGGRPAHHGMPSTQTRGATQTGPARNLAPFTQNNNNCRVENHLHMNDNRQYHVTTDNHTRQNMNVQYTSQRGPTHHNSHDTNRHRSTNQSSNTKETYSTNPGRVQHYSDQRQPRYYFPGRAPSEDIPLRGPRTREQLEMTPLRDFFGCGPRSTRVPDDRPC